jgi:hypothetical protein
MFEAARTVRADNNIPAAGAVPAAEATSVAKPKSNMEDDMADEKLQEAVATLTSDLEKANAEKARLSEQLILRDAKDMVTEALKPVTHLPEITKARLSESLVKGTLPTTDGVLDREAFKASIEEAIKGEVKYLETVLGKGQIRGLGERAASFRDLGLTETGAKIAARGRG